jgi:hypothetical protein
VLAALDSIDLVSPRPPSAETLAERIADVAREREDSSRRLHLEIDTLRRQFEALQSRPLDVDRIRFPPKVVASIVAAAITMLGAMYAITAPLRSDISVIVTKLENKDRLEELQSKVSEQQTTALNKAIDQIDRQQKLQDIKINELREMVLKIGVKP